MFHVASNGFGYFSEGVVLGNVVFVDRRLNIDEDDVRFLAHRDVVCDLEAALLYYFFNELSQTRFVASDRTPTRIEIVDLPS